MFLTRRLQDAWKVLWGRSEAQQEIMHIRSEWFEVRTDIANTLAKLSTWAARQAKQEQRRMANDVDVATAAGPVAVAVGAHPPPGTRKAELRRRLAQARGLPQLSPVSLSSPPEEESP